MISYLMLINSDIVESMNTWIQIQNLIECRNITRLLKLMGILAIDSVNPHTNVIESSVRLNKLETFELQTKILTIFLPENWKILPWNTKNRNFFQILTLKTKILTIFYRKTGKFCTGIAEIKTFDQF